MARLYLIPNLLSDSAWQDSLPAGIAGIISELTFFIAEDIRNTRRFIKKVVPASDIASLCFFELNKHTSIDEKADMMVPLRNGNNTGLISEAGCPGVADPGADIVRMAHQQAHQVVPLIGPSSFLLALMASGLNGQNFAFSGYLPVKQAERMKTIRQLEKTAVSTGQTQIFMETPYRNNQMMADLLRTCHPATLLCVASDLTSGNEFVKTRSVGEWSKQIPDLDRHPAVFLLGR
jgi:16S rRNA (cytidine1402-2'-O)-methyltransferase